MQPLLKSEAERARNQNAALTKHYRPIGLASVAAALICVHKMAKKPARRTV